MAETPKPKLPIHKRLVYIGTICIAWSHLEYLVARCIWWMLKLDDETGKIVTGGLDMLPRLNMAINLAEHLNAPKALTKQLIATRKAVQDKLDVRRNRAVHGVQFWYDSEGQFSVEVHRGKGGRKRQPSPDDELYDLTKDISAVSKALSPVLQALVRQRQSETATMLANMRATASEANSVAGS